MGQAKSRLARFKLNNPVCCYCGGQYDCESVNHAPPRTFFWQKHRPKGLEVPSCLFCNRKHAPFDDFFSLIALLHAGFLRDEREPRTAKLVDSARSRFPEAIEDMTSEFKPALVSLRGVIRPAFKVSLASSEVNFTISYMACRIALALFYQHTKKVAEIGTRLYTSWVPHHVASSHPITDEIIEGFPLRGALVQGNFDTTDQFETAYNADASERLGMYILSFHSSFRATVFQVPFGLDFSECDRDDLFVVTKDGIEPVGLSYPCNVRMPSR